MKPNPGAPFLSYLNYALVVVRIHKYLGLEY